MKRSTVLYLILLITAATLVTIITLALHTKGTDNTALFATIIGFVAPTIGILVAMLRLDQVTSTIEKVDTGVLKVGEKVDTVKEIVNGNTTRAENDRAEMRQHAIDQDDRINKLIDALARSETKVDHHEAVAADALLALKKLPSSEPI